MTGFCRCSRTHIGVRLRPNISTPICLFVWEWRKHLDTRNNNTYIRDKDGFQVVNFKHKSPNTIDPFSFPEQCTQVFFAHDNAGLVGSNWRIFYGRSLGHGGSWKDTYISTTVDTENLSTSNSFQRLPKEPNLVENIQLNDINNAITLQDFSSMRRGSLNPQKKRREKEPWKAQKRACRKTRN